MKTNISPTYTIARNHFYDIYFTLRKLLFYTHLNSFIFSTTFVKKYELFLKANV